MTTITGGDGKSGVRARVASAPWREETSCGKVAATAVAVTLRAWWAALTAPLAGGRDAVRGSSPWQAAPPSLASLATYTREGSWVPGERAPWLEILGKGYGYVISLPVHAAAYGVLWVLARPTRLLIACVLGAALRWTL